MNHKLLEVASLILDFGRIERATQHQDGVRMETDTDHTVMLGILGASVASKLYPDLDVGLVAQFALIHDLVEVHAGDTDTIVNTSTESLQDKSDREAQALKKIEEAFGEDFDWIHKTIEKYDQLDTKEARFVKLLDKVMPKLTVVLNKAASFNARGITKAQMKALTDSQRLKYNEQLAYDMPELMQIWEYFVDKEKEFILK
jgi:putative hydrolase of HD superfamily